MVAPGPGEQASRDHDDTLMLLFMCCHPALTPASQVALTLPAVGGLTTAEVASAFLVPGATMGPRISRYVLAARRTTSLPEQRYLRVRAGRLTEGRRPR